MLLRKALQEFQEVSFIDLGKGLALLGLVGVLRIGINDEWCWNDY